MSTTRSVRALMIAAAMTALTAAPLFAQEPGGENASGYVAGLGGFASSVGNSTGNMLFEAGARVAPHVMIFGNLGRFSNLQTDLQPTLTATTTSLAATQGLQVIGGGTLPAVYFGGGVRVEIPTKSRVLPYVIGGFGLARLQPAAIFTYSSGIMPDGSAPAVGADVTSAIATSGNFDPPDASNEMMFTFGGGAHVLVAPHWAVDVAYRYSRIAADTSLSATALKTNGMTFGASYRF